MQTEKISLAQLEAELRVRHQLVESAFAEKSHSYRAKYRAFKALKRMYRDFTSKKWEPAN